MKKLGLLAVLLGLTTLACSSSSKSSGDASADLGVDAGSTGDALPDSNSSDVLPAEQADAGTADDSGAVDGPTTDDASTVDSAPPDAAPADVAPTDVAPADAAPTDAAPSDDAPTSDGGATSDLGLRAVTLAFSADTMLPANGGTGDPTFSEPCPAGQALVGLAGRAGGWIDRMQPLCGTVAVVTDNTATPPTYRVTVGTGTPLGAIGGIGGDDWTDLLTCPADQVVTAIGGTADPQTYVDSLTVTCSTLAVKSDLSGLSTTIAPPILPSVNGPVGDGARSGAAFTDSCAADQVVRVVHGNGILVTDESAYLDAIGVACASIGITLQ